MVFRKFPIWFLMTFWQDWILFLEIRPWNGERLTQVLAWVLVLVNHSCLLLGQNDVLWQVLSKCLLNRRFLQQQLSKQSDRLGVAHVGHHILGSFCLAEAKWLSLRTTRLLGGWGFTVTHSRKQLPEDFLKSVPQTPCPVIPATSLGMCKKSTTVYLKSPKPENSKSQMFVHKSGINYCGSRNCTEPTWSYLWPSHSPRNGSKRRSGCRNIDEVNYGVPSQALLVGTRGLCSGCVLAAWYGLLHNQVAPNVAVKMACPYYPSLCGSRGCMA